MIKHFNRKLKHGRENGYGTDSLYFEGDEEAAVAHVYGIPSNWHRSKLTKADAKGIAIAEHLVRCWNCHTELREALKLCAGVVAGESLTKDSLMKALEAAHAALRNSEVK